jgi:AraC family transcriptional regulator, regulatory protein of adaptative response / DNA-3-methyladenine glycosylase II
MPIDPDQCYQAIVTRDSRFDGLFFVGVTSTKIYCRPICRSRRPALKNCRFFRHAAAAEVAGFRPCLRCRPELAPGDAPIDFADRLTAAAIKQIEAGNLSGGNVNDLARRLGVSDRHLRRVLVENLGVTPIQLAQTQRLLLAKQLLADTHLSIIDVAFASGFSSVRRFNALFRERYRLTPGTLREAGAISTNGSTFKCRLFYRPPFDWETLLQFFSNRLFAGVETIENARYLRAVRIDRYEGWIAVAHRPGMVALEVEISMSLLPVLMQVLARVRRMFDLNANPGPITIHLGSLAEANPGLRVPGAFDGFEMIMRAILGQQVSVRAATTMAGRVAKRFGQPLSVPHPALTHTAPAAAVMAAANGSDLAGLGLTRARAASILAVARAVSEGFVSLEIAVSIEEALKRLKELPGIGDWTAHYFAMRVLSWPDAFPHSDLGILKALNTKSPRRALEMAEKWRPWRAYAAMHLWKSLSLPDDRAKPNRAMKASLLG